MNTLVFIFANAMVVGGCCYLSRRLRLDSVIERVAAAFILVAAQIIGSLLLAGAGLHQLKVLPVLGVNAAFTAAMLATGMRLGVPGDSDRPADGWKAVWAEIRADRLASWLAVLVAVSAFWTCLLIYLLPPFDADSMSYHLVTVVGWLQAGRITWLPYTVFSNVYPANSELLATWLFIFLKSDVIVESVQLLMAIGGAIGVAGIARSAGLNRASAFSAGCLFFLTPIVLAQANANYNDVTLAALFVLCFFFVTRYLSHPSATRAALAGLAGGMAVGTKSSGLLFAGVAFLLLLAGALWLAPRRGSRIVQVLSTALLISAPVVLLGGYWYARPWLLFGNPFYPYSFAILGHTLFHGIGTVNAMIMERSTPPSIRHFPWWLKIPVVWFHEPEFTVVDQRLGGLGLQWAYLQVPATIWFIARSAAKRHRLFLTLIAPIGIIFLLQPANWWSRYTLFVVALGATALLSLCEALPRRGQRDLQAACILLTTVSTLMSLTHHMKPTKLLQSAKMPAAQRTVGRIFLPECLWVDTAPASAGIAVTEDPLDGQELYPYFGMEGNRRVMMFSDANRADFVSHLKRESMSFVVAGVGSPWDRWAQLDPQAFHLISEGNGSRAYRIDDPENLKTGTAPSTHAPQGKGKP